MKLTFNIHKHKNEADELVLSVTKDTDNRHEQTQTKTTQNYGIQNE